MPKYDKWERREDETQKAYEAFSVYRDLGTGRTVAEVGRKLQKSRSLLDRWKDRYDWVNRAREYDTYIERAAKEKAVKDHKSMITRHLAIATQLQKKALDALKDSKAEDLTPKDIREYIKLATDLERTTRSLDEAESYAQDNSTLADMITEAYAKRKEREGEGDA